MSGIKHPEMTPLQEKAHQRQLERERLEALQREEALRKEREEAERKEAAAKRRALEQAQPLVQKLQSMESRINQAEQQLASASTSMGNMTSGLEQLQITAGNLKTDLRQLQTGLSQLGSNFDHLGENMKSLNTQVQHTQKKIKELAANWSAAISAAKMAKRISEQALNQIAGLEVELQALGQELGAVHLEIANTESWLHHSRNETIRLQNAYQLLSKEINLLKNLNSTNSAALLEIRTMRIQGYQLREIVEGQEIGLWFEDQTQKKRLALNIKPMLSSEGLQWLRELSGMDGFDKNEVEDLLFDTHNTWQSLGIEYEIVKNLPKPPPPIQPIDLLIFESGAIQSQIAQSSQFNADWEEKISKPNEEKH